MHQSQMRAAHGPKPTTAQVTLHLVFIGVIGQLPEPTEIWRAIVEPQAEPFNTTEASTCNGGSPDLRGSERTGDDRDGGRAPCSRRAHHD